MEALLCGQTTYPAGEYESTWRTVQNSLLSEQFEVNIKYTLYTLYYMEDCPEQSTV